MLKKIYKYLLKEYPLQISLLVILMLITGILGSLSVASVVPLIQASGQVADTESTGILKIFNWFYYWLNIEVTVVNILLLVTVLLVVKSLLNIVKSILMRSIQSRYEITSKEKLLTLTLNSNVTYLYQQKFGKILNVLNQETRLISSLVIYVSSFVNAIINVFIYIALIFIVSWELTLFASAVGVVTYFLFYRFFRKARVLGVELANNRSLILETFQNSLYGHRVIKSYIIEDLIRKKFKQHLKKLRKTEIKSSLLESVQTSIFEPLTFFLCFIAVMLWNIPITSLIIFIASLGKLYLSVMSIQNTHYKIAHHVGSLDIYEETIKGFSMNQEEQGTDVHECETIRDSIDINNLCFRYDSSNDAFQLGPLDFKAKIGQTIGLVGSSGSGKSTFTDLVLGLLVPESGSIMIDGVDMKKLNIKSFRRKVSYVEQAPFMFNDSIKNNITLKEEGFTLDDIKDACKRSHIEEFIEELPEKYETILGEKGASLSGGQEQRIALARAIIRRPEILILDEATCALDNETERNIQKVFRDLHGTMTIIVIAHRLSSVKYADVIYVFDRGKIVESGGFEQLLQMDGRFADLHAKAL